MFGAGNGRADHHGIRTHRQGVGSLFRAADATFGDNEAAKCRHLCDEIEIWKCGFGTRAQIPRQSRPDTIGSGSKSGSGVPDLSAIGHRQGAPIVDRSEYGLDAVRSRTGRSIERYDTGARVTQIARHFGRWRDPNIEIIKIVLDDTDDRGIVAARTART